MGILLDIAYFWALLASVPFWLGRMLRDGRYRDDWAQRMGRSPLRHSIQPVIWVHGVSLGEVNAARPLVTELARQLPDFRIVISSTTDTGIAAARRHFAPGRSVFRWPMDFTWAVSRALNRTRPSLVILMEGEAWPNFLAACNDRNIPAMIVNGRMSPDKGYPRYKKLGRLARDLFNRLAAIGVQDEQYAERFLDLGVAPGKLHLTGMMKFDTIEVADHLDTAEPLAEALGIRQSHRLWVAGGTGPGEEPILLDIYKKLRNSQPDLRLAIVPRKPERFDEVAKLIEQAGLTCRRRSAHPAGSEPGDLPAGSVILGDTMGELKTFYSLGEVVFVGRSLVEMGGSDMIEPAALARPVCFGPHTYNFPQAEAMTRHGCVRVADAAALEVQLDTWLADPAAAREAGLAAQQYVRRQQGATKRNVALACHLLGRVPALRDGDIATDRIQE